MRVLHIYSGNLFGGIETLLITLARERHLCPQMEPHFALCFEGKLSDALRRIGISVHILGNVKFSQPWTVWKARRQLSKVLHHLLPDIVINHETWTHCLAAPVIRYNGIPIIFWMHGWGVGNRWYEYLARKTSPTGILATSYYSSKSLSKIFPNGKTEVLYPPVSRLQFNEESRASSRNNIRDSLAISQESTVILTAGRVTPYKGYSLLIKALNRIKEIPNWVSLIVGTPQTKDESKYFSQIQKLVSKYGLQKQIKFLGYRNDVPLLMRAADLFCQANVGAEPFGIVFIEALYAGLPIVTTRLGGAIEIVTDGCGKLVEANNVGALSTALLELIADPEKRQKLGGNGLARAKELCDPYQRLSQLHIFLEKVLAQNANFN